MSGSVFSETLQQITDTKLDELSKKRAAFEENKKVTLSSIQSQSDPIERLVLLSNGVKKSFGIKLDKDDKVDLYLTKHPRLEVQLKNLDRFLAQARQDPSVSAKTLSDWEKDLLRHLEVQSLKFQYASLYGQLVTEWLSGDQKVGADKSEDTEMGDAFEDVGSSAKLKSKQEWENKAFEPAHVDIELLNGYLETVFGLSTSDQGDEQGEDSKKRWQAVQNLRESVKAFEVSMSRPDQLNHNSLRWTIRGLLASDLLTNEKREVLKDFLGNPVILSEIADVLNLRLAALGSWKWAPEGVQVEQRRKISGVFSVHMHEDVLQAIFLQYIGVKWSVFFRGALVSFRKAGGAWTPLYKNIPWPDKRRLNWYLGPVPRRRSLQKERQKIHSCDYFVGKLLRRVDEVAETADGEVEAEFESFADEAPALKRFKRNHTGALGPAPRKQLASKAARKSAPSGPESDVDKDDEIDAPETPKTLMQLKQQLVHLLSTEIAINTRLHGELTAFHAMFEDWESLLPHETIFAVLSFLGVSQHWLDFFKQYLQAPLRFMDEDHASFRVRRRGVPTSHALSDVLGETVLFCLDLAVNQAASRQPLWRYGDDLWFWSADHDKAVAAWQAVEHFAEVTGTSINRRKTGTVRVANKKEAQLPINHILPQGEIRWGFLVLSPQTGRFEIDHGMVDAHIDELRKQLSDKSSVFSFIQTWNAFAAKFFSSNFGKSANCFGRQHVDDMLATHKRIQQHIFSSGSGSGSMGKSSSIIGHLRKTIEQRFGIADVPDGYFYFPVELGGLDLQSPFISLLQIRDSVLESPDSLFKEMYDTERAAYARLKGKFDSDNVDRPSGGSQQPWQPELQRDRENFLGADEFVRHREELGVIPDAYYPNDVVWVFEQLMAQPEEESIDEPQELLTALAQLAGSGGRTIKPEWDNMDASWQWITAVYGPEVIQRFGGLKIVDPGLLPMGMVGLLREKRVTWQG